jgi:hypothetical protein
VLLRAVGSYRRDVATAVATEAALGGERGG